MHRMIIFTFLSFMLFAPSMASTYSVPFEECEGCQKLPGRISAHNMKVNEWNTLSQDLFIEIFDFLSFSELKVSQQVCKYWYQLAQDESLSLEHYIFKKSFTSLLAKIDKSEKFLTLTRQTIDNIVTNKQLDTLFYASPDVLYKALFTPSAMSSLFYKPKLASLLFKSNIKASQIHTTLTLKNPGLDKDLESIIVVYAHSRFTLSYEASIFSQEFIDFTWRRAPQIKAFYLLSLFDLPSSKPFSTFLNFIFEEMVKLKAGNDNQEEKKALYFPQAMVGLEIPAKEAYKIGFFCYKQAQLSSNQTYRQQWEEYEELFVKRAAISGIADAQYRLASLLYVRGSLNEAEFFYYKAARQGLKLAIFDLGKLLIEQSRFKEAEAIYLLNAILNTPHAQCMLGKVLLLQGKNKQAQAHYLKAADQGCAVAQYEWGRVLIQQGKYFEAENFLLQAAKQNYIEAQYELGCLYHEHGHYPQAEIWYSQAKMQGHRAAQHELGLLRLDQERLEKLNRLSAFTESQDKALTPISSAQPSLKKENSPLTTPFHKMQVSPPSSVVPEQNQVIVEQEEALLPLDNTLIYIILAHKAFEQGEISTTEEYFCKLVKQESGDNLYNLSRSLLHSIAREEFDLFQSQLARHGLYKFIGIDPTEESSSEGEKDENL